MEIGQAIIVTIGVVSVLILIISLVNINPIGEMKGWVNRLRWKKRQKKNKQNELKLKSLSLDLGGEGEIDLYIEYNRHRLPSGDEWDELLPEMIKDLLSVGWNRSMPIYTKYKYWLLELYVGGEKGGASDEIDRVISKYVEMSLG